MQDQQNDVSTFIKGIREAITDANHYLNTCADNHNLRYCLWEGQSSDGRKWEEDIKETPFPWDGASDARIRLADEIINEQVAIMTEAFLRSKPQTFAIESSDFPVSKLTNNILRWLRSRLRKEIIRESTLLAEWRQTYGSAILGIFWEQEKRVKKVAITLQELTQMYQTLQQKAPENPLAKTLQTLLERIHDPLEEEGLIDVAMVYAPDLKKRDARKLIVDLREKGEGVIPTVYVFRSLPKWVSLRVMQDVIFPKGTYDIQRAPWVAYREWFEESELEAKIEDEDWDAQFVEEAKKHKGGSISFDQNAVLENKNNFFFNSMPNENKIEVYHIYQKVIEEGHVKIKCSIIHGKVEFPAFEYDLDYAHGEYPFVVTQREMIDRLIIESRGVPEILTTHQNEIKVQRDSRTDRTSIATLPPVKVPASRADKQLVFGPAAQIPERRPGEVDWMRPPPFDQGSIEIERAARADADTYFGRLSQNVNPVISNLFQQSLTNRFLEDMSSALVMTFQLMQQFMAPEELQRIAGFPLPQWSPEVIREQYDLALVFDVRDLDGEFVIQKSEMISKTILPTDVAGITNRAMLTSMLWQSIDPTMANQLVQNVENVTQNEIDDESKNLAMIVAGIEPPMKPSGQNFELRLQTLQNLVNANPELQQTLQAKPMSQEMLKRRVQYLEFQIAQRKNAQIGRIGAVPVTQTGGGM
jgi:hypothetical protein